MKFLTISLLLFFVSIGESADYVRCCLDDGANCDSPAAKAKACDCDSSDILWYSKGSWTCYPYVLKCVTRIKLVTCKKSSSKVENDF